MNQVEAEAWWNSLTPEERECIRQRLRNGKSVEETADIMQTSEAEVRALERQALEKLNARRTGQKTP